MKNSHLSELEIQQLVELSTPEREQNNAYHHIRVCKICGNRFHNLERLHAALREQQIGPADEAQVERVMELIRSEGRRSIMVPLLHRLAYVLAMLLVLTVIGAWRIQSASRPELSAIRLTRGMIGWPLKAVTAVSGFQG